MYTDIASGPNAGGENNLGAYLSIFGKNFGGNGLGRLVKVEIGGVEVDNYRYLGPSKGRADVQQISVQIGALGNPTPATSLPVQVRVNGIGSNKARYRALIALGMLADCGSRSQTCTLSPAAMPA